MVATATRVSMLMEDPEPNKYFAAGHFLVPVSTGLIDIVRRNSGEPGPLVYNMDLAHDSRSIHLSLKNYRRMQWLSLTTFFKDAGLQRDEVEL